MSGSGFGCASEGARLSLIAGGSVGRDVGRAEAVSEQVELGEGVGAPLPEGVVKRHRVALELREAAAVGARAALPQGAASMLVPSGVAIGKGAAGLEGEALREALPQAEARGAEETEGEREEETVAEAERGAEGGAEGDVAPLVEAVGAKEAEAREGGGAP
jgi:hypothetical protein